MRIEAARESYPYVIAFGAQNASPPTRRLYPLIVGTTWFQGQSRSETMKTKTCRWHYWKGMRWIRRRGKGSYHPRSHPRLRRGSARLPGSYTWYRCMKHCFCPPSTQTRRLQTHCVRSNRVRRRVYDLPSMTIECEVEVYVRKWTHPLHPGS